MDPTACLERWAAAMRAGDVWAAREAAEDLMGWIGRGGFEPKWGPEDSLTSRACFVRFVREMHDE